MFGLLQWRPRLSPLECGLLILLAAAWFWFVHRRLRRRLTPAQARLLLAPKVILFILLLVALLDPVSASEKKEAARGKLLALVDASASMDTADDYRAPRLTRAQRIIADWQRRLPPGLVLDELEFDTALHPPGKRPPTGERGTDLGGCLLAAAERPDISAYKAVVVLTDGGDEALEGLALPSPPLSVIGLSAPAETWNDVSVVQVEHPDVAEKDVDFEVTADLQARAGHGEGFSGRLTQVQVTLERATGTNWQNAGTQRVDLSGGRARARFSAKTAETGLQRYRVSAAPVSGELSLLNNQRAFTVEVQKKALRVLYFARELGQEFKLLRGELARDPGITFTALFRTAGERFTLQGDRLPGDTGLDAGLPADKKALESFDGIILGAFRAEECSRAQMQALAQYVEGGGVLIFQGGEKAFGRGGYADTPLAVLFPWRVAASEPEPARGLFAVETPPAASGHPVLAGVEDAVVRASAVLESVNLVGEPKPAATVLLNARVGPRSVPVVAFQPFGNGKVLAIASNTLWKWATGREELRVAYGLLWRQALRNLAGKAQGGQNLGVKWDRAFYRPGEQATATINVLGLPSAEGLRFTASLAWTNQATPITVEPVVGQPGAFTASLRFRRRGDYGFRLVAYRGERVLESYEKAFAVGPLAGEGSRLELNEAFLKQLANPGGGAYLREDQAGKLLEQVSAVVAQKSIRTESSLAEAGPYFALAFVLVLAMEWTMRRRMNLWVLAGLVAGLAARAQPAPRQGGVQFSNGDTLTGAISMIGGAEFTLHVGGQWRKIPLAQVQEIRLAPEQEEMAQNWRFVEAGQTRKETEGKPYPLRQLRASVVLAGNQVVTGHLYTAVLYVEGPEKTEKVVLLAKQRGKEGETLESLVYPARVWFSDSAAPSEKGVQLELYVSGPVQFAELAALTRGGLIRLEGEKAGPANEFRLPSPYGQELFLAVKTGERIVVGWPPEPNPALAKLVRNTLPSAGDFFDERQVLGVFHDQPNTDLYALVRFWRKGATTLAEERSQPWRVGLLRWKYEATGPRLMLAGQGYFFRGIVAKNQALPTVQVSAALWNVKKSGGVWTVGAPGL